MTEAGSRLMAERFAEYLLENGLLARGGGR